MTHEYITRLVGTYWQLYMLGLFIVLVTFALWPRKGRSFEQHARIPFGDEKPLTDELPPCCREKGDCK
jgi:cbb3-type cytochrome oxidase subunit 3